MSAAHTPGPWSIDDTGYRAFNNGLCIMAWPECVAVVSAGSPDQPQDANARLIAAAPDLLSSLMQLLEIECNESPSFDGWESDVLQWESALEKARAAIAKATGATT